LRKKKDWPPEKIAHQILNGGQKMPPFGDSLTDGQIAQLVAYLRAKHKPTLPAPGEPVQTPAAK
jgi:mono/diheme cytochrome c family protein